MSHGAYQDAAELADGYATRAMDLLDAYTHEGVPPHLEAMTLALLAIAAEIKANREAKR